MMGDLDPSSGGGHFLPVALSDLKSESIGY